MGSRPFGFLDRRLDFAFHSSDFCQTLGVHRFESLIGQRLKLLEFVSFPRRQSGLRALVEQGQSLLVDLVPSCILRSFEGARQDFYRYIQAAAQITIRVANTGGGTITTAFELTNYVRRNGPNLEVRGLQTGDYILLWLKHPEFNWMYRRMGMTSDEQPAGRLTLRDVPDGTWSAQWLDTVEARPVGQEMVTSKNGILSLPTPPTAKSVVVRLQRQK